MLPPFQRRTIGIDVDGVLLDIHTAWLKEYFIASGHELETEDCQTWDLSGYIRSDWIARFKQLRTPELYRVVKPIPGAVEGVRALAEQGHRLVVITHDTRPYVAFKRAQIERYFPNLHEFVFTDRKDCVRVDVLIDDAPHNVKDHPGGILLDQPWNRCYVGGPRVSGWDAIPRLFSGC